MAWCLNSGPLSYSIAYLACIIQVIRSPLEAAVEGYNPKKEVVVLVRARCGYMAVMVIPLVPEWVVCRQLGAEYLEKDALQLNLDDN